MYKAFYTFYTRSSFLVIQTEISNSTKLSEFRSKRVWNNNLHNFERWEETTKEKLWSCGNFSRFDEIRFFIPLDKIEIRRNRGTNYSGALQRGKKDKRKKSLTRSQFPEPGGSTSKTRLQNHPVIPLKPLSNVFRVTQLFRPHRARHLLTKSIDLSTDRIIGWVVIVNEYRKRFGARPLDSFAPTFLTFDNNDQPICKKPYDEKGARDERVYRVNTVNEHCVCVPHSRFDRVWALWLSVYIFSGHL